LIYRKADPPSHVTMQIEPVENCDAGVFVDVDFDLRRSDCGGHREGVAARTEALIRSGELAERRSSADLPT
jgi:hypothetical protein